VNNTKAELLKLARVLLVYNTRPQPQNTPAVNGKIHVDRVCEPV